MATENFDDQFLSDFNSRKGRDEEPGSASLSSVEIRSIRALLKQVGMDKDEARKVIIEHGFPLLKDDVGPKDLGETAYKHLCVVAGYLNKVRGADAAAETVESYITKNRFDRWVERELAVAGRINRKDGKSDLTKEWYDPIGRIVEQSNSEQVQYPEGVDNTKIFGVAKPHRYWPSQLIRYLEYVRLGKITSFEEIAKLGLEKGQEKKYAINWDVFQGVVREEESVDGIAAGIAVKAMHELKEHGLDDNRVAKIILVGYSLGGPLNEHGNIPQITNIWSDIIERVGKDAKLKNMKPLLLEGVKKSFESKGFEFVL